MSEIFDYAELQEEATTLIAEFGRPLTVIRESTVPQDALRPWAGPNPAASTSLDVIGVIAEPSELSFDDKGSLVRRRVRRVYISVPSGGERVDSYEYLWDGERRYRIRKTDALVPGPLPLLYELIVEE